MGGGEQELGGAGLVQQHVVTVTPSAAVPTGPRAAEARTRSFSPFSKHELTVSFEFR